MDRLLNNQKFRTWLVIMGTATLVIGASYTMVQQSNRLAADDLPLTIAQTAQDELRSGSTPSDVVPNKKIDLRSNGNVFVIVTDDSGHALASSANLDGQTPLPPQGVFDYTYTHGTDHFTWQPTDGIRLATRVMTYSQDANKGYVITGQSLKQAENRESLYLELAVAAWFATLAWTYLVLLLPRQAQPQTPDQSPKSKKKSK